MIAAVVPAAGQSTRMGRPKLILPIAGGGTVIGRLLDALRLGGVDATVVVGPPFDAPGAEELLRLATFAAASAIPVPSPTADMRSTVEHGIEFLEGSRFPLSTVLLAPGDSIGLTPSLVAAVIARARLEPSAIILPVHDGRRGHPLALPWELARSVRSLPPGLGINSLRDQHADRLVLLDVPEPGTTADLDTPEDYRRWSPSY